MTTVPHRTIDRDADFDCSGGPRVQVRAFQPASTSGRPEVGMDRWAVSRVARQTGVE